MMAFTTRKAKTDGTTKFVHVLDHERALPGRPTREQWRRNQTAAGFKRFAKRQAAKAVEP
jgi:hypothetical protein